MSHLRRSLLVAFVAVLGIALAAAITWGTSQLVRQRIGLASEPLTAGSRLLAPSASTPANSVPRARTSTDSQTVGTATSTSPQSPTPTQTSTAPSAPESEAPSSSSPPSGSESDRERGETRSGAGGEKRSQRDD